MLRLVNEPTSCSDGSLQGAHCKGFPAPSTGLVGWLRSGGFPVTWGASRLRDPAETPPPADKGPGMCPRMSPAAGSPVLGGWQPPLPPADSGCPLPREGIAGICLGVQLLRGLLGSVPLGTVPSFSAPLPLAPPLLLPPTAPVPCVSPRVCPALGGGSPLLPPPQFGQAGPQHPQASCCSRGHTGSPGSVTLS